MQAVIFDMDGVIVDSEFHWNQDELSLIKQVIPSWSEADHQRIIGLNIVDTFYLLQKEYGLGISKEVFLDKVETVALNIYHKKTQLTPGLRDQLEAIKAKKLPCAVASSSKLNWIRIVMERFELDSYFDVILSALDIQGQGKPAPDIYLETAKRLGVKPENCIVIEDSTNGVLAAKAAGMTCIGFRNGFNEKQNLSAADNIIHHFDELHLTEPS